MSASEDRIIECKKLSKDFGGLTAVNEVSFEVKRGQIFGIIGPNGAGKSTLFNLMSGFLKPTAGEVVFEGKSLAGIRPDKRYLMGLAMTFQLPQYFPELTVLENVVMGALSKDYVNRKKAFGKAGEVVEFIGLAGKSTIAARNLTVADLKRLEVAKVLAGNPKCILLDEVMAGLTAKEISEFIELLKQINSRGVTIILIEHVMKAIMSVSQYIMALNYGVSIALGKPEEIATNDKVIEAYLGG